MGRWQSFHRARALQRGRSTRPGCRECLPLGPDLAQGSPDAECAGVRARRQEVDAQLLSVIRDGLLSPMRLQSFGVPCGRLRMPPYETARIETIVSLQAKPSWTGKSRRWSKRWRLALEH